MVIVDVTSIVFLSQECLTLWQKKLFYRGTIIWNNLSTKVVEAVNCQHLSICTLRGHLQTDFVTFNVIMGGLAP